MIREGVLIRVYKNKGAPLADVDLLDGGIYTQCPIMMWGAATEDEHFYHPPGTRVACAPMGNRNYIVLGSFGRGDLGKAFEEGLEVAPGEDHPADKADFKDAVWRHAGNVIILKGDGGIIIDATNSEQNVQVQLADGACLRISQAGEQPTERTLLSGPTRDVIDALVDRVNTLKGMVQTLALAAAATVADLPAFGLAGKTTVGVPVQVLLDLEVTTDELDAAALLLSDKSMEGT